MTIIKAFENGFNELKIIYNDKSNPAYYQKWDFLHGCMVKYKNAEIETFEKSMDCQCLFTVSKTKRPTFKDLIIAAGYKSVNQFANAIGQDYSMVYKMINTNRKPKIETMFLYANALKVDFNTVLNIFYEEELENNKKVVEND